MCIKRSMHALRLIKYIIYHDLITPFRLGISPQARTETIGHFLELNSKCSGSSCGTCFKPAVSLKKVSTVEYISNQITSASLFPLLEPCV